MKTWKIQMQFGLSGKFLSSDPQQVVSWVFIFQFIINRNLIPTVLINDSCFTGTHLVKSICSPTLINRGVPQGGILGPLFFLLKPAKFKGTLEHFGKSCCSSSSRESDEMKSVSYIFETYCSSFAVVAETCERCFHSFFWCFLRTMWLWGYINPK